MFKSVKWRRLLLQEICWISISMRWYSIDQIQNLRNRCQNLTLSASGHTNLDYWLLTLANNYNGLHLLLKQSASKFVRDYFGHSLVVIVTLFYVILMTLRNQDHGVPRARFSVPRTTYYNYVIDTVVVFVQRNLLASSLLDCCNCLKFNQKNDIQDLKYLQFMLWKRRTVWTGLNENIIAMKAFQFLKIYFKNCDYFLIKWFEGRELCFAWPIRHA